MAKLVEKSHDRWVRDMDGVATWVVAAVAAGSIEVESWWLHAVDA
jgi:hypothetical protein